MAGDGAGAELRDKSGAGAGAEINNFGSATLLTSIPKRYHPHC